jgi:hypothetical protein
VCVCVCVCVRPRKCAGLCSPCAASLSSLCTPGNCQDQCPTDPEKYLLGECGCFVAETDSDNDGTPDCVDDCPTDPMKIVEGQCGCFNSELDSDNDGTADCNDNCPSSPIKIEV